MQEAIKALPQNDQPNWWIFTSIVLRVVIVDINAILIITNNSIVAAGAYFVFPLAQIV